MKSNQTKINRYINQRDNKNKKQDEIKERSNEDNVNSKINKASITLQSKVNSIISTVNQKMIVRIKSKDRTYNKYNLKGYINKSIEEVKEKAQTRNQFNSLTNNLSVMADTNAITNPELNLINNNNNNTVNHCKLELEFTEANMKTFNRDQREIINKLLAYENSNNNNEQNKNKLNLKTILSYIANQDNEIKLLRSRLKTSNSNNKIKDIEIHRCNEKVKALLSSMKYYHITNDKNSLKKSKSTGLI